MDNYRTTGLVLSKEERLFGVVDYAIFQEDGDYLRCVEDWGKARELLVEAHFDLVMVDESAVVNETFEGFCSFIRRVASENTICAFFVRSESPDLRQMKNVLGDALTFVEMAKGQKHFFDSLKQLKERAIKARSAENARRQTVSLDESMGRVDIDLPVIDSGKLAAISLSRLLYAIRFRRLFGELTFSNSASGQFSLKIQQGRIVDCSQENLLKLFALFGNPRIGEYSFREDPSIEAVSPKDAIEPIDLIWEGLSRHVEENVLRDTLSPFLNRKVIPTNLYRERCVRYSGIGVLGRLVEAVQKCSTLKAAIELTSYPTEDAYAAAMFALRTDMLVVQQSPLHRFAQVVYPRNVRQQRQKVTDRAKRNTKAYRITSSDLQRVQIEDELRARVEKFEKSTPYEIMGVWEGCGKKVVNDTFYKMVREHHPDTYGGNVSGDTKRYADRVFVLIQKARTELLKREREQKCPEPPNFRKGEKQAEERSEAAMLGGGVQSPLLGVPSQFDSMASFREGFDSSEVSYSESGGLSSEVSESEARKQRIRNLHEKRRRLSSVAARTSPNGGGSPSRERQNSSLELPSLASLTGPSVVRTSRPSTAQITGPLGHSSSVASNASGTNSKPEEPKTTYSSRVVHQQTPPPEEPPRDRLDRLSRHPSLSGVPAISRGSGQGHVRHSTAGEQRAVSRTGNTPSAGGTDGAGFIRNEHTSGYRRSLSEPSSNSGVNNARSAMQDALNEGIAEFERGNWEKATKLLLLANRYVADKKIDVFLSYARYMQDPQFRNDALAQMETCTSDPRASFDAYRLMGRIYADSGGWELARACFVSALKIENDPVVSQELKIIEQKIEESQSSSSLLGRWFSKKK